MKSIPGRFLLLAGGFILFHSCTMMEEEKKTEAPVPKEQAFSQPVSVETPKGPLVLFLVPGEKTSFFREAIRRARLDHSKLEHAGVTRKKKVEIFRDRKDCKDSMWFDISCRSEGEDTDDTIEEQTSGDSAEGTVFLLIDTGSAMGGMDPVVSGECERSRVLEKIKRFARPVRLFYYSESLFGPIIPGTISVENLRFQSCDARGDENIAKVFDKILEHSNSTSDRIVIVGSTAQGDNVLRKTLGKARSYIIPIKINELEEAVLRSI